MSLHQGIRGDIRDIRTLTPEAPGARVCDPLQVEPAGSKRAVQPGFVLIMCCGSQTHAPGRFNEDHSHTRPARALNL